MFELRILFATLGCAFAACDAYCAAAGNVGAEVDVSAGGAMIYRLPLLLPAGIDGLQPSLALVYDSQSDLGPAGKSFTLSGLPAIQRCGQTSRRDGVKRPVSLTAHDRFCLDSKRLVLDGTSKAYGANGAAYRFEFDEFARITSSRLVGSGPEEFKVEEKSGLIHTYGGTPDSRLTLAPAPGQSAAPASIFSWALSQTRDRIGNTIDYAYDSPPGGGAQYIKSITYNGGRAKVSFEHQADNVVRRFYTSGGVGERARLLKSITVTSKDDAGVDRTVSLYKFEYEYNELKGGYSDGAVARLRSLTYCGSETDCLEPVVFGWSNFGATDAKFQAASTLATDNDLRWGDYYESQTPRRFGDFNNDGIIDIVGFGTDGVWMVMSVPGAAGTYEAAARKVSTDFNSWSEGWQTSYDVNSNPRNLVDMNRDGYLDIVGFSEDYNYNGGRNDVRGMWISFWDANEQEFATRQKIANGDFFTDSGTRDCYSIECAGDFTSPRFLVDMNQDGYPDVLAFKDDGVWLSYWTGNALTQAVKVHVGAAMDTYSPRTRGPVYVDDMDRDGYPDIVSVSYPGTELRLWDPTAQRFSSPILVSTEFKSAGRTNDEWIYYPTIFVDMNADGMSDMVKFASDGLRVSFWDGVRFGASSIWSTEFKFTRSTDVSRYPWRVADFDGDGFPDFAYFGPDGLKVALSDGHSRFLPSALWTQDFTDAEVGVDWPHELKAPRYLVDLDNDGSIEIVGFSGSAGIRVAKQQGQAGARVTSITDPLGAVTTVQYSLSEPQSGMYLHDEMTSGWPERDAHSSLAIVTEVARDDGLGGQRRTRYWYRGRKAHYDDGQLGFRSRYERDMVTGVERRSDFRQTYPYIGLPDFELRTRSKVLKDAVIAGCTDLKRLCYRSFLTGEHEELSRIDYLFSFENLAAAGESVGKTGHQRVFRFLKQQAEKSWDLYRTILPTKLTVDSYDEPTLVAGSKQWGNRTKRVVTYEGGWTSTTSDSYIPAIESSWTVGRLSKRVTTATRPARSITTVAPTDAALTPDQAPALPLDPAVLSTILSVLLDDE